MSMPVGVRDSVPGVLDRPEAAERAVAGLLEALGLDVLDERRAETPRRVSATCAELLSPHDFEPATSPSASGPDGMVLVKAVPLRRGEFMDRAESEAQAGRPR